MSYDTLNSVLHTNVNASNLLSGCSDSSGQNMVIGINASARQYSLLRSTNFGKTWNGVYFSTTNALSFRGLCCSSDGSKIAACASPGNVWLSTNSGTSWTEKQSFGGAKSFVGICCSTDGNKIAACANGGNVWLSDDSGTNWAEKQSFGGAQYFQNICCSFDRNIIAATTITPGNVWISNNSGSTWSASYPNGTGGDYGSIACNSDGTKIVVGGGHLTTGIWLSTNSGSSWSQISTTITPYSLRPSLVVSSDGNRILAGNAYNIWLSTNSSTFSSIYKPNANYFLRVLVSNSSCSTFFTSIYSSTSKQLFLKTFYDSGASNYTYKGTPLNKIMRLTPESDTASTLQLSNYKTTFSPSGLQCDISFGGTDTNSKITIPTNFFTTPTATSTAPSDYLTYVAPKYYKYDLYDPQNHTFNPNCNAYLAIAVGAGGGGGGGSYSVDPANPQTGSGGGGGGSGAITWFYCPRPSAVTDISYAVGFGGDGAGNTDSTTGYRYGSAGTAGGASTIYYITNPSTITAYNANGGSGAPAKSAPVNNGGAAGAGGTATTPTPVVFSLSGQIGYAGKGSGPSDPFRADGNGWAVQAPSPATSYGNGINWNLQPSAVMPGRGGSIQYNSSPIFTIFKNNRIDLCSNLVTFNSFISGSSGYQDNSTTIVSEIVEYGRGGWGGLGESGNVTYGPVADFGGNTYNDGAPGVVIIIEYFS